MKVNAPDIRLEDGSTFNAKNDPRVTKIGKILRETSIDEIPQILNILFGQMTIIGPRPDLDINMKYPNEHKYNLKVRPGITGYTQAYYRNETNWYEKIKFDRFYVDNISFALDMRILFRTIYIVLKKEKMYRKNS